MIPEKKSRFARTVRPQHAKTFSYLGSKKRVDFKMLKWTLFFAPQMAKYQKKSKCPSTWNLNISKLLYLGINVLSFTAKGIARSQQIDDSTCLDEPNSILRPRYDNHTFAKLCVCVILTELHRKFGNMSCIKRFQAKYLGVISKCVN